ncbi:hypothetical protein FQN57_003850 [Myotisia sp. PD_48]|nr:hypothetical protein FQN57_003850 [Myotisia sp. PD_48]
MDLSSILPEFPAHEHADILQTLENCHLTTKELLHFDAFEIARRSQAPVSTIRTLITRIIETLHKDLGLGELVARNGDEPQQVETPLYGRECSPTKQLTRDGFSPELRPPSLARISTLDPILDAALDGGISTGYLTEVTGASGSGKTQFLLHLLLSVQLELPLGLSKRAIYVSTESDLSTSRLSQLLQDHPVLRALPSNAPQQFLNNILSVTAVDLETQDHVLYYQVPVAISRYNVGLVIIDSITANYRARNYTEDISESFKRSWELKRIGHLLRTLAVKYNIAIVVANQISDRFGDPFDTLATEAGLDLVPKDDPLIEVVSPQDHFPTRHSLLGVSASRMNTPAPGIRKPKEQPNENGPVCVIPNINTLLHFENQQPFFNGWGDIGVSALNGPKGSKTPALGLVWTNQIGCRIVLKSKARPDPSDEPFTPSLTSNQPPKPRENQPSHDNRPDQSNQSTPAGTSSSRQQDSQAPTYRGRPRVMQVVFSPWTSGNPGPHPALDLDFDTVHNPVEFEVLPSGICGIKPPMPNP